MNCEVSRTQNSTKVGDFFARRRQGFMKRSKNLPSQVEKENSVFIINSGDK